VAKKDNSVDIAVMEERLDNLKNIIEKGFAGVHQRQDIANGKLMRHDSEITVIKEKIKTTVTKEQLSANNLGIEKVLTSDRINNNKDKISEYAGVLKFIFGMIATFVVALALHYFKI